jgi:hypothetical protein
VSSSKKLDFELQIKNLVGLQKKLETVKNTGISFKTIVNYNIKSVIEQVASNKSSLLQKINLQNAQTLKLFTKIIKT